MRFSDETLMAYADGELDLVARAEIEAAIANDPEVARAVERHRLMAAQVRAPTTACSRNRCRSGWRHSWQALESAVVVDLAARRDAHRIAIGPVRLPAWAALAASLAFGLFVGVLLTRSPATPYETVGGALVARGELDEALDSQLASAPDGSSVRIGISFRDRDGDYCRTFHLQRDASVSGLACRSGEDWQLQVLAAAPTREGELRPAAAMPVPVLHAVDAAIDGEPLDAAAEARARDAGWR